MGHSPARILWLLLTCLYPLGLGAGLGFAFREKRKEAPRVSTAVWREGANAEAEPAESERPGGKRSYPLTRVLVALAGSVLLAAGNVLPSSTLVRSAAVAAEDTGPLLYVFFALVAIALAVTNRFRPLYLAGGIPLLLLLTVGVESTILMQKYPAYAQEFYGQSFGLGWGWIFMIAGAGLILFAAVLQPTHGDFYKPPPASATTRRET